MVTTGLVHVAGEVTTSGYVDIPSIVRDKIVSIGYDSSLKGFDGRSCGVEISIGAQSPDIAQGVDTALEVREDESGRRRARPPGRGRPGHHVRLRDQRRPRSSCRCRSGWRTGSRSGSSEVRKSGELDYLRPDGKTQVTIGYEGTTPKTVNTVVLSTQHAPEVTNEQLHAEIESQVIRPVLGTVDLDSADGRRSSSTPPAGSRSAVPQGDAGLTGRKIIIDTYGGASRHGGGAFSGKDPSKVDRSAAYAMRWVAKNAVAAGFADRLEVQVAYAIGKAHPVGLYVETFGTAHLDEGTIIDAIQQVFDLRPGAIIRDLDLLRPIYSKTSAYGHFGRELPEFTWERTDRVEALRSAAGL